MTLDINRRRSAKHELTLFYLAEQTRLPGIERLVLDPPFQRGSVWTVDQQVAWIESILEDLPLPTFFINRVDTYEASNMKPDVVIDGRQRLEATLAFMDGRLIVRGESYLDQPDNIKRKLRTVSVNVRYSDFKTEAECVALYLTLLKAGTAHTKHEIEKAQDYLASLKSA